MKPYTDISSLVPNVFTRILSVGVDSSELEWHRDEKDREVTVVSGTGWSLQFEDSIPIRLEKGLTYQIKALQYHRVHKGDTDLILRIQENGS